MSNTYHFPNPLFSLVHMQTLVAVQCLHRVSTSIMYYYDKIRYGGILLLMIIIYRIRWCINNMCITLNCVIHFVQYIRSDDIWNSVIKSCLLKSQIRLLTKYIEDNRFLLSKKKFTLSTHVNTIVEDHRISPRLRAFV